MPNQSTTPIRVSHETRRQLRIIHALTDETIQRILARLVAAELARITATKNIDSQGGADANL